jgi:hypothetical protein
MLPAILLTILLAVLFAALLTRYSIMGGKRKLAVTQHVKCAHVQVWQVWRSCGVAVQFQICWRLGLKTVTGLCCWNIQQQVKDLEH